VEGGKWTVFRKMAEDTLDRVIRSGMLEASTCKTRNLQVFGATPVVNKNNRLHIYGSSQDEIIALGKNNPELNRAVHPNLPYTNSEIVWICRNEMPRKLEDMLARRTRSLFLHAEASREMACDVATIMAEELGFSSEWITRQTEEYGRLVEKYVVGKR
jgi:glycerol-3-phosphate dehydrogenase